MTKRSNLPQYEPVPPTNRGHPVYLTKSEWLKHGVLIVSQLIVLMTGFWWFSIKLAAAFEGRFTRIEVTQQVQTDMLRETRQDVKELNRKMER